MLVYWVGMAVFLSCYISVYMRIFAWTTLCNGRGTKNRSCELQAIIEIVLVSGHTVDMHTHNRCALLVFGLLGPQWLSKIHYHQGYWVTLTVCRPQTGCSGLAACPALWCTIGCKAPSGNHHVHTGLEWKELVPKVTWQKKKNSAQTWLHCTLAHVKILPLQYKMHVDNQIEIVSYLV